MKRLLHFALALASFSSSFAQTTYVDFEVNGFHLPISSNGDISGGGEIMNMTTPGVDAGTIYAANMWLVGLTSDDQLRGGVETFQSAGQGFFCGPLTLGTAETNQTTMDAYDEVYLANSEDVQTHMAYFEALANNTVATDFPDGYTIPEWMFGWPAHGDYTINQALYLAPFYDYNGDGVYNPEEGDYPLFCGDKCAYVIFNDRGAINPIGIQPIGIEVHMMVYGFETTGDPTLENTIFIKYKIINRGTQTLTDTYFGKWIDFDIGSSIDDYVATDVKRSAIYGYNADDSDEGTSSSSGYGDDLAAQGLVFLAGPMLDADATDNPLPDETYSGITDSYGAYGYGFGDGIVDNERFGLSSSIYYNIGSNPIFGDPNTSMAFYNYMHSTWQNGASVKYGGNGVSGAGVTDLYAQYFYPGDTDPLYTGTGGIAVDPWTEANSGNPPGDRRMLGAAGPFTLTPGSETIVDLAYVFARQSQSDNDDEVGLLQFRMQQAKNLFNLFLVDCGNQEGLPTSVNETTPLASFSMFPNPANTTLNIVLKQRTQGQVQIFSANGQLMIQQNLAAQYTAQTIDVSTLSAGVYFVKMAGNAEVHQLIIQ
ncbi:MAG: T9SS type A sorting domain-containing protein [Flavobacteriales bacterium]